jgi:acyl transferase domain-containing protein
MTSDVAHTGPMSTPAADGERQHVPIAVVGLSCRLPGAATPAEFWRLLRDGSSTVGAPPAGRTGRGAAGYLQRIDEFDAEFFGISPREAAATDPQQRLLLELAWEALEDARTVPQRVQGAKIAVFAAAIWDDYAGLTLGQGEQSWSHHTFAGTRRTMLANRISHFLRLTGPSLTVDTGQSSSLVAVHLACDALRRGEADAAIVGAANLIISPESTGVSERLGALSAQGRCFTFDARADGYVRGEGGAVVVLKPLAQALAGSDRIYGVILGSAVNNDGGGDSLGVPRGQTQEEAILLAHRRAGTSPADVRYVELHGTGTPAGDPVEAAALGAVAGAARPPGSPLAVGSVKTNIGHLEGAAGIAGLLKTVLCIAHRELVPSLNYSSPNPRIPLESLNLRVQAQRGPWPDQGKPLVAGVSSFGYGGTNCHVIVAEAPAEARQVAPAEARQAAGAGGAGGGVAGGAVVWALSGRSVGALAGQAARLRGHVAGAGEVGVEDVGLSLVTTRSQLACRGAVVGRDRESLLAGVAALAEGAGEWPAGVVAGSVVAGAGRPVLVFPGQGAQWAGMGLELAREFGVFAEALAECGEALRPVAGWDLEAELAGDLARVDVVQPALWAVMVSLARLWRSFGVEPAAVVGHSQGELAAAVVAGALPLADAARVVALRSRLIGERLAGRGGMVWVGSAAGQVREQVAAWDGRLSVAAVNGPAATVVSGEPGALDELMAACERAGVMARPIPVDYASHSAQVEQVEAELLAAVGQLQPRPCQIPFHSTVTGQVMAGTDLDARYWYRNLRQTVQLEPVIGALLAAGHTAFVEMSPHPVLAMTIQQTAEATGADTVAVGSLRENDGGRQRFVTSLAHAWAHGVTIDWRPLFPATSRRIDLPTYPFQRERYWLTPHHGTTPTGDGHPLRAVTTELAGTGGALLTATVSRAEARWLSDHTVAGSVVVPGTLLVELALEAGHAVGCGRLEEFTLQAPMTLPEHDRIQLQVRVSAPEEGADRPVTVHARPAGARAGEPWALHASGLLAPHAGLAGAHDAELQAWPPPRADLLDLDGFYPSLAAAGYGYGPAFRGVTAAWRRGDEVFAEVSLPASDDGVAWPLGLHPALFDAALHGALRQQPGDESVTPALPFAWSGVELSGGETASLRVHLTPTGPDSLRVSLADGTGQQVARVESLVFRHTPARPPASKRAGLFKIDWVRLDSEPGAGTSSWRVLEGGAQDLASLSGTLPGIVIAPAALGDRGPAQAVIRVLTLLQEWLASAEFSGSQLVVALPGGGVLPGDSAAAAAVAGLVRSAQNEHPGRFGVLHLHDSLDSAAPAAAAAFAAGEPEVRVRTGEVTVPRLASADGHHVLPVPPGDWCIDITEKGTLDNLAAVPAPRAGAPLAAGQVRILMRAAGLNFRDIVVALNMVPGLEGIGQEGAGIVAEVAPDVSGLAPGDRVMGLVPDSMGPRAVTDARTLVRLPAGWTFEQGASVPVVFLTAWMGLAQRARLAAGERVLIHAATGGFGLAAVQLARHLGAEVFATASSAKQHLLRELGLDDDHIASTRTTEFRDQFLAVTGGDGMDAVINVLAGQLTDASLDLLPRGGRFIEMGKTDVRDPAAVAASHPGVAYEYFDLVSEPPDAVAAALRKVTELLTDGTLQPPPVRSWPISQAKDAFELMRRAEHLGKIVFTLPSPLDPGKTVLITGGTGTLGTLLARHLVTTHGVRHLLLASRSGAAAPAASELRALGADVRIAACDVGDRQALRALLAGISAEHPLGAVIHAAGFLDDGLVEGLTAEQVTRVLRTKAEAAAHLSELTAGAELDAFVLFSSIAGVAGTAGQANYAAANACLDELARQRRCRGLPAVSMAWGLWQHASGMTGHMAGHHVARLARTGVAALDTAEGMALFDAALHSSEPVVIAARLDLEGLRDQRDAGELPAVFRGFAGTAGQAAAATANGRAAAIRAGGNGTRPAGLPAGGGPGSNGGPPSGASRQAGDSSTLAQQLAGEPPAEAVRVLTDLVRSHASAVLRLSAGQQLAAAQSFSEAGFDSLTAVELRNRLNKATGLRLASTVALRHSTASELAAHLYSELFPAGTAAPSAAQPAGTPAPGALDGVPSAQPGEPVAGPAATDDEMFTFISEALEIG